MQRARPEISVRRAPSTVGLRTAPPPVVALLAAAVLAALAPTAAGQANPQFEKLGSRLPVGASGALAIMMGDVDGDGDLDIVCGRDSQSGLERLYRNDGRGHFADVSATQMPAGVGSTFTRDLAFGDVDGDGDLDVIASCIGPDRLYLNDGSGTFTDATASQMPAAWTVSTSVAAGDIDGDGDVDLVFGATGYGYGATNHVYVNDGTGTFTDGTSGRIPADQDWTSELVLGDVDGDGDLDLVVARKYPHFTYGYIGEPNGLLLNDGTGTFVDGSSQLPLVADATNGVALGDVDGDGDLDVLFANGFNHSQFPGQGPECRLLVNSGTGTFVAATGGQLPLDNEETVGATFGDLDGDGDLDILVTMSDSRQLGVYLNSGAGNFVDATAERLAASASGWVHVLAALGDVDGDGDLDVAFADSSAATVHLRANLLRQLDAQSAPQLGQNYTFETYARYGAPRLSDVALPYVSFAPASIPLPPFGTVGIDPAVAVALAPVLVPQPAGVVQVPVAVPSNGVFIGLSIYAQAALIQYPLQPHLTNVTHGVVQ